MLAAALPLHLSATGNGGRPFSPGTHVDGSAFLPCPPVARVDVAPPSATINQGQVQQFTAQAFDSNNQPISGVIFKWNSSNTAVATINGNGLATGVAGGSSLITATARERNPLRPP